MPLQRTVFLVSALLAFASPTSAQESKPPLPSHFPAGKEVCFGRVYGETHLKLRPGQTVTSLHIFRDLDPDQNTEDEPQTREELLKNDGDGGVNISAYVRFKNRKGIFWNTLNCSKSADGHVTRCSIDCDGGSFDLQPRQQSLLLTNNGFVLVGGCGASDEESENPVFFSPGADDKVFRLEPLPLAQCTAIKEALRPAYAKMGMPLRVRFETNEAACYSRSYDDAHLKKNPQQTVKRIALLKPTGGKDVHKDAPGYDLAFRIETRDGRKFTQTAKCYPDRYAYTCPVKAEHDTAKDFYVTRAGDTALMIRDRAGKLSDFFGTKLGTDDRTFRLNASAASACEP